MPEAKKPKVVPKKAGLSSLPLQIPKGGSTGPEMKMKKIPKFKPLKRLTRAKAAAWKKAAAVAKKNAAKRPTKAQIKRKKG